MKGERRTDDESMEGGREEREEKEEVFEERSKYRVKGGSTFLR